MEQLGQHILLDAWGVDPALLDNCVELEKQSKEIAVFAGAGLIESRFHRFEPQGVSGILVLSESHLAVHTWPERGFAAFDVFTCGDPAVGERMLQELVLRLSPSEHLIRRLARGSSTSRVPT